MNNKGKHKVLAVPDLQAPFQHQDTLAFLKWLAKKEKPTKVVSLGDEADFHALGDWDHDPDGYSAGHELEAALEFLHKFYKQFPEVQAVYSNHSSRPLRKAFKAGIPAAFMKSYAEFLQSPKGWQWNDKHVIDGITYEHGEGFSGRDGAMKCAMKNGGPTVIGHIHSFAGIQYWANSAQILYGFNVGCLIDQHKYAFKYAKNNLNKPILGAGIIDKGVPKFIPMLLDKKNRWIGR